MRDRAWAGLVSVALAGLFLAFACPPGERRNACLWDEDTLRTEAAGLPGVAEIIVGRFDRFPDLYYEMRLTRVTPLIESDPDQLEAYDDAGVACDRLGRDDEAIEWMAQKLAAIERLEASGEDVSEHRYRYLANLGTFHVHRWVRGGGDRGDMSDLEQARDLIAEAIELNPDAHFGRERYQLLAIKWLLDPPVPGEDEDFYRVPLIFDADPALRGNSYFPRGNTLPEHGYGDAIEGLTGLIALGAAWESVDIFHALTAALRQRGDASVALLAQLRREELLDEGRVSFYPVESLEYPDWVEAAGVYDSQEVKIKAYYKAARAEAESWREARNAYLLERLTHGDHPDINATFWASWEEPSQPPQMPGSFLGLSRPMLALVIVSLTLVVGVGLFVAGSLMAAKLYGMHIRRTNTTA
ncbi:MAG: hypothetical protein R3B57_12445 [Phycisphaerales bacterium]